MATGEAPATRRRNWIKRVVIALGVVALVIWIVLLIRILIHLLTTTAAAGGFG